MEVAKHSNLSERAQEDYKLVCSAIERNDQNAFAELMKRYRESIYYMVLKMVHNKDDAEDLTIEAFGKAFNKIEKYSPDYAFSTWLFKIAINNAVDFIRKKRIATTSLDNPYDNDESREPGIIVRDSRPDPEEGVIKEQRAQITRGAIDKLNPKHKVLIELRYFKEYSYDEISTELDIPLGTVKAQLFRAKEMLFRNLHKSKEKYM